MQRYENIIHIPDIFSTIFPVKSSFINFLNWKIDTQNIDNNKIIPVKKYFYDLDFENLYNILREKQQKELEK